jgi:hypothetical protein
LPSTEAPNRAILDLVPPVLVCRIAWMDFYAGVIGGDKPTGGGAYVKEHGFGYEVFNFLPDHRGVFRGYVRPPGSGETRIKIEKLAADRGADQIDGVTVFWAATDPKRGGTRIVGWYADATVFREWQPSPRERRVPNGEDAGFFVQAKAARLIPSDDRTLVIPRAARGVAGIGQANIWYPPASWLQRLYHYQQAVSSGRPLMPPPRRAAVAKALDAAARLRVESAAVAETIRWCEERGLPWRDVSLARCGWDLEAGEERAMLRIEVKGSSLPIGNALLELTPNEFAKMKEHRDSFRLAVVSVVPGSQTLVMFAWSEERSAWTTADGSYALALRPVVGARVEVIAT